ncbi:MAG: protein kinase [Verrucomicrobia bacterium]|nr:protein kinase [Verrucomicrobiota bacterium]
MNGPRESSEEALYEALMATTDPRRRQDMLEGLAATDPVAAARLKALLAASIETEGVLPGLFEKHHQLRASLGSPGQDPKAANEVSSPQRLPVDGLTAALEGVRIGRYKLLEKLGEGGCGVVYAAQQYEPVQRRVAVKVIKPGMDTDSVLARFDLERQALALMDHPNISKVFDAGSTEAGRPYFVMELVLGSKITDFCDQNHLTLAERVNLFIQVCGAIQHAHQKGIIHRDIKPSNILVTRVNDVPVPKVIDFGVAKAVEGRLTDATVYTQVNQIIGTPSYMSPEQVQSTGEGIDTRSDIYSLGVLLYELLTGRTPFDGKELVSSGLDKMRRVIREQEAVRPSTCVQSMSPEDRAKVAAARGAGAAKLARMLSGDLDWIVLKCLEKARARRYETANGLSADLLRFLNHEVVIARPPNPLYRLGRMARRNRGLFVALSSVLIVFFVGGMVSFASYLQAAATLKRLRVVEADQARLLRVSEQESASVRTARDVANRNLYAADIQLAFQSIQEGNLGRARTLLSAQVPTNGSKDLRGFEWRYLWNRTQGDQKTTFRDHKNNVVAVAWSPDRKWLASGGADVVRLRSTANGAPVAELSNLAAPVTTLSFSPDSRKLAVASDDAQVRILTVPGGALEWTITNASPRAVFSPASPLLAIGVGGNMWAESDGEVQLWDTESRTLVAKLPESGDRAAFSPDGRLLVTANYQQQVSVFNLGSHEKVRRLKSVPRVMGLAFAVDGKSVFLSTAQGEILQWNLADESVRRIRDPGEGDFSADFVTGISVSPDGRTLAASRQLHEVELWDLQKARRTGRLAGHESEVWGVAFSPDGETLATASFDHSVRLWAVDARPRKGTDLLPTVGIERGRTLSYPLFTPDSKYVCVMAEGWAVHVLNAKTLKRIHSLPDGNLPAAVTADGQGLVTVSEARDVILRWDLVQGRFLSQVHLEGLNGATIWGEQITRDGARIVFQHGEQSMEVYDTLTGKRQRSSQFPFLTRVIRMSGVHDLLMLGGSRGDVGVVDLETGQTRWSKKGHGNAVVGGSFSPDGRLLATASWDRLIHLWSVATGEKVATLNGHKAGVLEVAFSSDGRTLASSSDDWTVKLWHVETLRELATIQMPVKIYCLRFAPDDSQLVVTEATRNAPVYLWQAPFVNQ